MTVPHHLALLSAVLISLITSRWGLVEEELPSAGPIDDGSAAVGLGQPHRRTTSNMNDKIKDIVAVVRTARYGVWCGTLSCCVLLLVSHSLSFLKLKSCFAPKTPYVWTKRTRTSKNLTQVGTFKSDASGNYPYLNYKTFFIKI